MGQFQYARLVIMCIDFDCGIRLNDLIHTAGEGLTLQLFGVFMSRVLLEYAYFCLLFASNGSPMYKSLTKTKNTQSLKPMKH